MDKITHEVRAQEWAGVIQVCNTSGQSKKQWCEENGVSIRKFFYWQKKLRAELYAERAKSVGIVRTSLMKGIELAPAFAEVPTTSVPTNMGSPFLPDAVIKVGRDYSCYPEDVSGLTVMSQTVASFRKTGQVPVEPMEAIRSDMKKRGGRK